MGGFDYHPEHEKAQWGEEEEGGGGSWRGADNLSWSSPAWGWTVTMRFTGVKVYTMCYCLLTMSSIRIKLFKQNITLSPWRDNHTAVVPKALTDQQCLTKTKVPRVAQKCSKFFYIVLAWSESPNQFFIVRSFCTVKWPKNDPNSNWTEIGHKREMWNE